MDGRKIQKEKKKDGELEWSLPGRERGRTEANDILLKGICMLVGKGRAASRNSFQNMAQSWVQGPSPLEPSGD